MYLKQSMVWSFTIPIVYREYIMVDPTNLNPLFLNLYLFHLIMEYLQVSHLFFEMILYGFIFNIIPKIFVKVPNSFWTSIKAIIFLKLLYLHLISYYTESDLSSLSFLLNNSAFNIVKIIKSLFWSSLFSLK